MATILISPTEVKNKSIIEANADDKVLSKVILNVQETHLKGVLGRKLYTSIIEKVNANISNSTAIDDQTKELIDDYIKPYMVYATLADFIVINNYKLSNKGLMKVSDNSAQSSTPQELEYVKNYYDNYLTTFKSNLVEYLKSKNLLSECTDTNTTFGNIGWYLP